MSYILADSSISTFTIMFCLSQARNVLEDDDNDYDVLDYRNSCSPVLYANKTIPVVECQEERTTVILINSL